MIHTPLTQGHLTSGSLSPGEECDHCLYLVCISSALSSETEKRSNPASLCTGFQFRMKWQGVEVGMTQVEFEISMTPFNTGKTTEPGYLNIMF